MSDKIYPPRTSSVITEGGVLRLPLPSLFAQVKLDGKCVLYRDGKAWTRHLEDCSMEIPSLPSGFTFVGEYLHTGRPRIGEDGQIWSNQYIIFDVLCAAGIGTGKDGYLTGYTGAARQLLLDEILPTTSVVTSEGISPFIAHVEGNIYRAKNLAFSSHEEMIAMYKRAIGTPLYEGLFIRPKGYKIQYSHTEYNNKGIGLRWRKPSNMYRI